jgi:hypothetical protein
VAVRTHDIALRHLRKDACPASVSNVFADVEALVAEVIELENQGVRLTAVFARVGLEVGEEVPRSCEPLAITPDAGVLDVALLVRLVMLGFVLRATRTTVCVALIPHSPTPVEVLRGLDLTAPVALLKWLAVSRLHKHMFAL